MKTRLIAVGLCVIGSAIGWFGTKDVVPIVALAGVGALFATKGTLRKITAAIIVGLGLWLIVAAKPLSVIGGALVIIGGIAALITEQNWATMGARYEREAKTDLWSAIDRGEDPTNVDH